MQSILVSVLVPVYNSGKYLPECLDSIINQSFPNLQIVLVNDGSTDCSDDICRQYANKDKRIEYHNISHIGVAGVRNYLLDVAKGDYSIFIDSDDWIELDMIEYMVYTIRHNNLDMLIIGHKGQTYNRALEFNQGLMICDKECTINLFLKERCLSSNMWSKLIRSDILNNQRFDLDIQYGEDVLMTWKLLNKVNSLGISESRLYHYRNNAESITNRKFNKETFSLHLVWKRIVESCNKSWPSYVKYAERQQDFSNVWLLYTAIRSNFNRDGMIETIQKAVKKSIPHIISDSNYMTVKAKLFTFFAAYNYSLLNILIAPIRSRLLPLR